MRQHFLAEKGAEGVAKQSVLAANMLRCMQAYALN
jgi:hypothetical protein